MNHTTLIFSGKKGSGKNTAANFAVGLYLTKFYPETFADFYINKDGSLDVELICMAYSGRLPIEEACVLSKFGVKVFSYADSLKNFCRDVLAVEHHKVWGTQAQKEELTHLLWDDLPMEIRIKYGKLVFDQCIKDGRIVGTKDDWKYVGPIEIYPKNIDSMLYGSTIFDDNSLIIKDYDMINYWIMRGPMSGREVLQIFGSDIIRRWYQNAWVNATFNNIKNWAKMQENQSLALICDARFPNEIDFAADKPECKTIRLLRNPYGDSDQHISEIALDNYPHSKYSLVLDNSDMTIEEQNTALRPYIEEWISE